jgi:hypothetical protein
MGECKHTIVKGKRKGEVCNRPTYEDTDACWGHQSKEAKAEKGFGGAQQNSGRPKLKDPFDVAREAVRQHAELLIAPHFKALGFDIRIETTDDGPILHLDKSEGGAAKLYGESKDGVIVPSDLEDIGAQIAAAEKILDRLFGKPRQALELSGNDNGPIEVVSVDRPEAEKGKLLGLVAGAAQQSNG